jgi:hypothetical protein
VSQSESAGGGRVPPASVTPAVAAQPAATGVVPTPDRALPTDPKELEAQIEQTRAHLVGTVDELATRLQPKEIARRGKADLKAKVDAAIRTPDGSLRVERLAAAAAAVVSMVSLVVWNRRRLRRRSGRR